MGFLADLFETSWDREMRTLKADLVDQTNYIEELEAAADRLEENLERVKGDLVIADESELRLRKMNHELQKENSDLLAQINQLWSGYVKEKLKGSDSKRAKLTMENLPGKEFVAGQSPTKQAKIDAEFDAMLDERTKNGKKRATPEQRETPSVAKRAKR